MGRGRREGGGYRSVSFRPRPSTGRPGSPHRYFGSSYDVAFSDEEEARPANSTARPASLHGASSPAATAGADDSGGISNAKRPRSDCGKMPAEESSPSAPDVGAAAATESEAEIGLGQVVHRHANGLCIVTAGEAIRSMVKSNNSDYSGTGITKFSFVGPRECGAAQSAGGKRKRKRPPRKGGDDGSGRDEGEARPTDALAIVTLADGRNVQLNCCVLGTVLELNRRLDGGGEDGGARGTIEDGASNPSLLVTDPLLDGYLAVILPTGQFPPQESR